PEEQSWKGFSETALYRVCRPPRDKENKRLRVADALMLHHIEVNIESIGPQNGDTPLQLLARAEPGEGSAPWPFLIARSEVVIVERSIAVRIRARAGRGLQHRR